MRTTNLRRTHPAVVDVASASEVAAQRRQLAFRHAVLDLFDRARSERRSLPGGSSGRRFLLGVDAALLEELHPELAGSRPDGWLGQAAPELRAGYLAARVALMAARVTGQRVIAVPRPEPAAVPHRQVA